MDPNSVYQHNGWDVMQHRLTDGSKTYAVCNEDNSVEIEAFNLKSAILIADCLAGNAA